MADQQKKPEQQQSEKLGEQRSLRGVSERDINRQDNRDLDEILNPDTDPDDNQYGNQYGNLDDNEDLYDDPEQRAMVKDAPDDLEAEDQYGPQDPIGSAAEPDTPGGQGLQDIKDQYGRDRNLVQPGSDRDQYGTKGSQDQYGNQQIVE